MSGRLVGEVVEWLRTPAAAGLTMAERIVLVVIAERSNDETREMWRFKADDVTLAERIQGAAGIDSTGLRHALQRLKKRGLEVRVPVKHGKDGRAVYAFKGYAMQFRLPAFPASVDLPQRRPEEAASNGHKPVDNSGSDAPQRGPDEAASKPKGGLREAQRGPDEAPLNRMYPYEELPYKNSGPCPYVAEVEDTRPAAATPSGEPKIHMGYDPTYKEARAVLGRLPDLGGTYMAAARDALGQETPLAELVIYAGQLAKAAS
jgi:hypothetical protein